MEKVWIKVNIVMQEREMTKKEKAKEKRLKDKYDDSDMKKSMKKQYGKDWKNVYYATIRKKAMERIQTEGEAGDHDRMYKVVHVKKGIMDIKAKTSYEAAKKFAKEKGLKSTAGVDTHLYPLEEASSPWTSSGKHPEDMSREELEHEIDIFKQYQKAGMSLSPKEIMRMDSLNDYLDTVDDMIKVTNIKWDSDDDVSDLGTTMMVPVPPELDDEEAEEFIANYITDKTGMTHDGFIIDEGYQVLPNIDKERYTPIQGMEGPFMTVSGKALYYDPQEGSYYDRDTDMFLTYDEFKQYDEPRTTMRSEAEGFVKNLRAKVEGHSPHKKGTKKYKAHMAAMHANSAEPNGEMIEDMKDFIPNYDPNNPRIGQPGYVSDFDKETNYINVPSNKPKLKGRNLGRKKPTMSQKVNQLKAQGYTMYNSVEPKGNMIENKATKKYRVTLDEMKTVLELDDKTTNEEIVANYVRTMFNESMDTWKKVYEEVQFVLGILKEGSSMNPNNIYKIVLQQHMQDYFDANLNLKENIDTLRKIVNDKQYQTVKFKDGSMKIDLTTASLFLQVFDKQRPEIQEKIKNKIVTKQGFLTMLDLIYGKM